MSRTIRILQPHVRIGDPHVTSDDVDRLSILGNVFEPLVRSQEGGSFGPSLASDWSVSEDARTWRFELREGVRFHDSKAFTAADAVFSLRRLRDEDIGGELGTGGVIRGYLDGARIEQHGPYNIQIDIPEPMADLADLLCDIPILSPESVHALPDRFIGTGSYRVTSAGSDLVVLENDHGRIEWAAEPDDDARWDAVRCEQADIASKMPTRMSQGGDLNLHRSMMSVCATFMFNIEREYVQNRHLRRAINLAIDVDELVRDVMHGAADLLSGPLTRRHLGYAADVLPWPFDPAAARAELKKGGNPEGTPILLDIPSVLPDEAPELAKRIQAYLGEVGIDASVREDTNRSGYASRVRAGDVGDAVCFDSSPASTFRVYREKFHSGFAGPWWLGYTNPTFDALVDEGQATGNIDKRRQIYRRAFGILRDDAPWIFLYSPVRLTAIHPSLSDFTRSTAGLLLF